MAKTSNYLTVFNCKSALKSGDVATYGCALVTIVKGQWLDSDGSGYATNTATAFTADALGVALYSKDASDDAAAGTSNVQVILPNPNLVFIAPVEANALITQAAVGTFVDLESNDGLDISDTSTTGWGFMIDEIDVSAEAIAVTTYGYAIGRFLRVA